MKKMIYLIIVVSFISCQEKHDPRKYESLDEFTGGYNMFELTLKKNGEFEMLIQTSRSIESEENGDTWAVIESVEKGTWHYRNKKIKLNFINTKSSIDKVFENSDFENFKENELINFSENLDTAYIYGIPCILEKK